MKVLVVGMGIAGLTAAIVADELGDDVVLLSKEADAFSSSSAWAQGGVVYKGVKDSPSLLRQDIRKAGNGMTREDVLQKFCKEAPPTLKRFLIDKIGVPFATEPGKTPSRNNKKEKQARTLKTNAIKTANKRKNSSIHTAHAAHSAENIALNSGPLKLAQEAAHSTRRIVFCGDNTGEVIVQHLLHYIKTKTKVKIQYHRMVVDLITIPHHAVSPLAVYEDVQAVGAYVMHTLSGKVDSVFAEKIILATGGAGQVYQHTTNPGSATGDGIAVAMRAGVRIVNMEFTQFHPTSLAVGKKAGFLISEAVRGEGAVLVNEKGEDFVARYDKRGALAPRDIVSRAIWKEQIETLEPHVYLNLRPLHRFNFKERFPTIYNVCKANVLGFEKKASIPVTPAFHFLCGGILTGADARTSLMNLFAIGECACSGIHGANRLASTSLLEGLYFAHLAARAKLNAESRQRNKKVWNKKQVKPWQGANSSRRVEKVRIIQYFSALRSLMWNYVGIVRTTENLQLAIEELAMMKSRIDAMYRENNLSKSLLELRNAVSVAFLIANAAIKNPISKGCHFRVD